MKIDDLIFFNLVVDDTLYKEESIQYLYLEDTSCCLQTVIVDDSTSVSHRGYVEIDLNEE